MERSPSSGCCPHELKFNLGAYFRQQIGFSAYIEHASTVIVKTRMSDYRCWTDKTNGFSRPY